MAVFKLKESFESNPELVALLTSGCCVFVFMPFGVAIPIEVVAAWSRNLAAQVPSPLLCAHYSSVVVSNCLDVALRSPQAAVLTGLMTVIVAVSVTSLGINLSLQFLEQERKAKELVARMKDDLRDKRILIKNDDARAIGTQGEGCLLDTQNLCTHNPLSLNPYTLNPVEKFMGDTAREHFVGYLEPTNDEEREYGIYEDKEQGICEVLTMSDVKKREEQDALEAAAREAAEALAQAKSEREKAEAEAAAAAAAEELARLEEERRQARLLKAEEEKMRKQMEAEAAAEAAKPSIIDTWQQDLSTLVLACCPCCKGSEHEVDSDLVPETFELENFESTYGLGWEGAEPRDAVLKSVFDYYSRKQPFMTAGAFARFIRDTQLQGTRLSHACRSSPLLIIRYHRRHHHPCPRCRFSFSDTRVAPRKYSGEGLPRLY